MCHVYHRLDEHQPPISALNRLLEVKPGNAVLRHKLRDCCEAGTDKLTYLLRKDYCRVGYARLVPFAYDPLAGVVWYLLLVRLLFVPPEREF
jgi:hypothetical protein